ncbi:site-2 protease family protein [Ancylothrix sp. C2]|uniref:site-2 protease family protein n=1 Tax=Ancylothrix sp. D3o TaxID=2953691 RepID=UPI0021BB83F0|nr:site-2 protease family protein [Ancylothrix sp. D3o]MCT7950192.1 site-2 protease family protein [Ancylothrix sp. D3o]
MQSGWRIGYLCGIPLYIDTSWLIILALLTLANHANWENVHPEWSSAVTWCAGFLMALLLFASVLIHELGHSLVAQSQGIKVNSIRLFLFGGIASIERESKTAKEAFEVAIAGPAVSFIIFALLALAVQFLPESNPVTVVAVDLARINLVLALFNLIPGLPLDGGQIVKAAVWQITGNRFVGVHWAAKAGKLLGFTAMTLGISALLLAGRNGIAGLWIALLGWFSVGNATLYERQTDLQETLLKLTAGDTINCDFRVVDANLTLREFTDKYLLFEPQNLNQIFYAASEGRYRGMVNMEQIHFRERSLWETHTLLSIVSPLTEIISVNEKTPLVEVINQLETHQLKQITVLSPAGAVAGVIDRGDIVRTVGKKLNLAISDAEIKQIKQEGRYPQSLQLTAMAKAAAEVLETQ